MKGAADAEEKETVEHPDSMVTHHILSPVRVILFLTNARVVTTWHNIRDDVTMTGHREPETMFKQPRNPGYPTIHHDILSTNFVTVVLMDEGTEMFNL